MSRETARRLPRVPKREVGTPAAGGEPSPETRPDAGKQRKRWSDELRLGQSDTVLESGHGILQTGAELRPRKAQISGDPVIALLQEAREGVRVQARIMRDWRTRYAVVTVLLSPFAIGLLAARLLPIHPENVVERVLSPGSFALLVLEIVVLGAALFTLFPHAGAVHKRWVQSRLRAELLQREEFLYRARVGPYLRCPTVDACLEQLHARMRLFRAMRPGDLIPLESEPDRPTWVHELEERRRDGDPAIPDASAVLEAYLDERVQHQLDYFKRQSAKHARLDAWYEGLATGCLILALLIACVELGLLVVGHPTEWWDHRLGMGALVLPAVGGAFVAIRTFNENHRLHHSYTDQHRLLEGILKRGVYLQQEPPEDAAAFSHEVQRLVLLTESHLSSELRHWWLMVASDKPAAS